MFRVKCDTQSEFESVVKKMEKETGLKCNVKNMPSEFRYVTTTVIDRTGDSMISLSCTAFGRMATPIFPIMDNLHMDTFFFFVTYRDWETDRKSTRLNSSHITRSRMPSSA